MFRSLFLIVLFLATLCTSCAKKQKQSTAFRIVQYNVENLFDTTHDSGFNDSEFLPDGARRWSRKRMWQKIDNISRVVSALSHQGPPDLVALEEVENDSVLTFLTRRGIMRRMGYDYVMTRSSDARGIDVALLYQPATFRLLHFESISPYYNNRKSRSTTRDILYCVGRLTTGDTLHVFVCHLPSKLGGKSGRNFRNQVTHIMRQHVDSILALNTNAHIVLTGDFNDGPNSPTMTKTLGAYVVPDSTSLLPQNPHLLNLSANHSPRKGVKGSYKYRNLWSTIDQMIVSPAMMRKESSCVTSYANFHIFAPDFLLEEDVAFGGIKPFRTYQGVKFRKGFSDHLPVYLDLHLYYKR